MVSLIKNKLFVLSLLLLSFGSKINAQQLPVFTQYLFNKYIFNPAVTGTEDNFSATANYRYQWQGVTDAPRTYILSVHGPHKFKNFGIGGALYTDVTGPTSKTGAYLSYAYHLNLSNDTKLSLGLSGGLLQYRVDGTKITLADPGDLTLANTLMTKLVPDFGFGAYWFGDKFFVGLSVPQFIQAQLDFTEDDTQTLSQLTSHFYLNGGYTFKINRDFDIEPSAMIRYSNPIQPQLDLTVRGIFQESYYLGLMHRTEDALAIMAGYQTANGKFTFGYAYDVTTSGLGAVSAGSHELMVKATFGKIKEKSSGGTKTRRKKMSKLERLEQQLKDLEEEEQQYETDDNSTTDEEPASETSTDEEPVEDKNEKSLQQQLAEVEQQDRELRAKVRALRDEAEAEGYNSPNDPNFPKRAEYLETLDKIKDVYRKKKELDALLD